MIPMKLVTANPMGMAYSWGHSAALGVFAREAKSGAFVMSVNMLLKHEEIEISICQLRELPDNLAG